MAHNTRLHSLLHNMNKGVSTLYAMLHRTLRKATKTSFVRFALVGTTGFIVDATTFVLLLWLSIPHQAARAIAFLPAATSNWFLNRRFTFQSTAAKTHEWGKFLTAAIAGFTLNWGTYALLTAYIAWFHTHLWAAFIAGITAGLTLNFVLARFWVFPRVC